MHVLYFLLSFYLPSGAFVVTTFNSGSLAFQGNGKLGVIPSSSVDYLYCSIADINPKNLLAAGYTGSSACTTSKWCYYYYHQDQYSVNCLKTAAQLNVTFSETQSQFSFPSEPNSLCGVAHYGYAISPNPPGSGRTCECAQGTDKIWSQVTANAMDNCHFNCFSINSFESSDLSSGASLFFRSFTSEGTNSNTVDPGPHEEILFCVITKVFTYGDGARCRISVNSNSNTWEYESEKAECRFTCMGLLNFTQAPTNSPTRFPTSAPTVSPSRKPSEAPSMSPTPRTTTSTTVAPPERSRKPPVVILPSAEESGTDGAMVLGFVLVAVVVLLAVAFVLACIYCRRMVQNNGATTRKHSQRSLRSRAASSRSARSSRGVSRAHSQTFNTNANWPAPPSQYAPAAYGAASQDPQQQYAPASPGVTAYGTSNNPYMYTSPNAASAYTTAAYASPTGTYGQNYAQYSSAKY